MYTIHKIVQKGGGMPVNHVPKLSKINKTGCCPQFFPRGWDKKKFTFRDKSFVRVVSRSFLYVPLNLGRVMADTWKTVEEQGAGKSDEFVMLSYDMSPWQSEHFLSVTKKVKGCENVRVTGEFFTRVFEGPYKDAPSWIESMKQYVNSVGKNAERVYLYYTTCPNCQKVYGKNYVVAFAKVH